MKNTKKLLDKINNQLQNIEHYLPDIKTEIYYLQVRIKYCNNQKDADPYFDLLDSLQLSLAKAKNRFHKQFSNDVVRFIDNFNELHDVDVHKKILEEIQKNYVVPNEFRETVLIKILEYMKENPKEQDIPALLPFLHEQINFFVHQIFLSPTLHDAQHFFDILEKMQFVLAVLSFEYDISMAPSLNKFIRDGDRLDDISWREHLFNKIKYDNYSYE